MRFPLLIFDLHLMLMLENKVCALTQCVCCLKYNHCYIFNITQDYRDGIAHFSHMGAVVFNKRLNPPMLKWQTTLNFTLLLVV